MYVCIRDSLHHSQEGHKEDNAGSIGCPSSTRTTLYTERCANKEAKPTYRVRLISARLTTPTVNRVAWTDADSDGFPDAGETLDYTITVTNAGTVSLEGVEVVGTSGAVVCLSDPQPVAKLPVGGSYECTMSHQVRSKVCTLSHERKVLSPPCLR